MIHKYVKNVRKKFDENVEEDFILKKIDDIMIGPCKKDGLGKIPDSRGPAWAIDYKYFY